MIGQLDNSAMRVEAEIHRRIGERGAITFAEFMELALFWPHGGYYLSGEPIGPAGDFYTSPQVHPVFGTLLAIQLFQMWELLDHPDPFTVVELGAGNGLLSRNVLVCSDALPDQFGRSLRYVCLDRRAVAGVEAASADNRPAAMVSRVAASGIPFRRVIGCFLSNEYLDSFPVHQVTMCPEGLRELCVIREGDKLGTCLGEPSTPALAARLEALQIELTAGQTAEICLDLNTWAEALTASLEAGFILTVDYGQQAAELYSPERRYRGTLTTFYRHTQLDAPLRHVGHQDITAQVDFTSVIDAGRRNGLESLGIVTQGRFLRNLGLSRMQGRLARLNLAQYPAQANRAGMLDLARPGGLGDFKVVAQAKGVDRPDLWGFKPSIEVSARADQVPVPLLTPQHLSLLESRYPAPVRQWEEYRSGK